MKAHKNRMRARSFRNRPSGANVVNRVFDSSGPEGKVRGTPQQIIDKYNQLARDAQLSNDRVAAENYMQHAEHYLRMLGEAQREQEARRDEHDRANRERQADRNRDRADRDGGAPRSFRAERDDSATGMETVGGELDTGLVETPESRVRRARAAETPAEGEPEERGQSGAGAAAAADKPDAKAPAKPGRRVTRKPAAKREAGAAPK